MTKSRHLIGPRHYWTGSEDRLLREFYADVPTDLLADELNVPLSACYRHAAKLGLRKSAAYMASDLSGRVQRGRQDPRMRATQFKPGMPPWNKGTHYVAGGRSALTRFKPGDRAGSAAANYRPIGSTKINRDGLLYRKVTDDPSLVPARRWRSVHELVWRERVGDVPPGHIVVFRRGMRTTVEAEITPARLECISRAENLHRNSIHTRYPEEVVRLIQLRTALNRKIRNREDHHEKQDVGCP